MARSRSWVWCLAVCVASLAGCGSWLSEPRRAEWRGLHCEASAADGQTAVPAACSAWADYELVRARAVGDATHRDRAQTLRLVFVRLCLADDGAATSLDCQKAIETSEVSLGARAGAFPALVERGRALAQDECGQRNPLACVRAVQWAASEEEKAQWAARACGVVLKNGEGTEERTVLESSTACRLARGLGVEPVSPSKLGGEVLVVPPWTLGRSAQIPARWIRAKMARRGQLEVSLELEYELGADGRIAGVWVLAPSVRPEWDQDVVEALYEARRKAPTEGGKPTSVRRVIGLLFQQG